MAELVECARLEIAYTGNCIEGSNPPISATKIESPFGRFIFVVDDSFGVCIRDKVSWGRL